MQQTLQRHFASIKLCLGLTLAGQVYIDDDDEEKDIDDEDEGDNDHVPWPCSCQSS